METLLVINSANSIINDFINDNERVLSQKQWAEYTTYAEVGEALRLHRLRNGFVQHSSEKELEMHKQAFLAWDLDDQNLPVSDKRFWEIDLKDTTFRRIRVIVARVLRDFTTQWRKVTVHAPDEAFSGFGPGAQYESMGSDVSLISKLLIHPWTVTRKAETTAKTIVRGHKALRRVVLDAGLKRARHLKVARGSLNLNDWYELIFELGWINKVKFVNGSRFESVPKPNDSTKRRPINVEPLLNLMVQRVAGSILRKSLRKHCGIDLLVGQSLHRKLIRNLRYATIDLSRASDLGSLGFMRWLLPHDVFEILMECRSPTISVNLDRSHHVQVVRKMSSMGNGFTFELLTLVVYAIARACVPNGSVVSSYGDDLIVERDYATRVMHYLRMCGYVVNDKKSFTSGPVRESCGGFTFNGRDLLSYDIKYCKSLSDVISTANKVLCYTKISPWGLRWLALWNQLSCLVTEFTGPDDGFKPSPGLDPSLSRDDSGIGTLDGYLRVPFSSMPRLEESSGLCKWVSQRYGKPCWKGKALRFIPRSMELESDRIWKETSQSLRLHTGIPTVRTLRGEGDWDEVDVIFSYDGIVGSVKTLRNARKEEAILFSRAQVYLLDRWLQRYSLFSDRY